MYFPTVPEQRLPILDKGSIKSKHEFRWGAKFIISNGKDTLFWEYVWIWEVPLKLVFPSPYDFSRDKRCLVSDCFKTNERVLEFCRSFGQAEVMQWEALLELVKDVHLNEGQDKVEWGLEKSCRYTARRMYRMLVHRGVVNKRIRRV